jgi:hypothetical protein
MITDVHHYINQLDRLEKKDMKKMPMKMVMEKKTGEKYKSKAAMKKHEKSEPASMRKKEYGSKGMKKGMR